jgi:hypothetical protein
VQHKTKLVDVKPGLRNTCLPIEIDATNSQKIARSHFDLHNSTYSQRRLLFSFVKKLQQPSISPSLKSCADAEKSKGRKIHQTLGYFVPPSLSPFREIRRLFHGACYLCVRARDWGTCIGAKALGAVSCSSSLAWRRRLGASWWIGALKEPHSQRRDDLITNLCATEPHQIKGGAP